MKRYILVIVILMFLISLSAAEQDVMVKENKLMLEFHNIQIDDIEFVDGDVVNIEHSDKDKVQIELNDGTLKITSDKLSDIDLELPNSKLFVIQKDGARIEFSESRVSILDNERTLVEFRDGGLFVTDDGETVEISADGIIVDDNEDHVEISSRGIIVDTPDEQQNITGFWGQLLGGAINFITKHTIGWIGNNPGFIIKHIINDRHDDTYVGINFSDEYKYTREVYKTFDPKHGCKLNVKNINGKVNISSWRGDQIDVVAVLRSNRSEKELDKIEIDVTDENGCSIKTKFKKKYPSVVVDYQIQIPEHVKVNTITSSNGSIIVKNCSGDMDLRTSNGRIDISDSKGKFKATSSNGRINFENLDGIAEALTSNGAIIVNGTPEFTKGVSSNGKIKLELSRKLKNDIYLSTTNGSVLVAINPKLNLDIEASTSNSNINIADLSVITSKVSDDHLRGKVNKGGKTLTVRTTNGKIKFYKLEQKWNQ